MSDDVMFFPEDDQPAAEPPVVTPGAIHVMENGVLRNATAEEIAEIEMRQGAKGPETVEAVPMLNLHLVLIDDGHLTAVQQMIEGMEGDDGLRARAMWEKAQTARRDNWLVQAMWPQLYEDEAAFNNAWRRAAALDP